MIWYALQEEQADPWDHGTHDKDEALAMLKAQGKGLIAVIDEEANVCIDEIWFKDIE